MFCRGVIIGTLKFELGDHAYVRCPELGLMADIEFKTKGYFGGTYNAIGGVIKDTNTDKVLYELSGFWNEKMYIKDVTVRPNSVTGSLLSYRLANENSCSTPKRRRRRSQRRDRWKSKANASRSAYGRRWRTRCASETTASRRRTSRASKTSSETRQRDERTRASTGARASSAG
jgi:hypothetical protein